MKALTIGQIARDAGVSVETVRFYERQGLLTPPERTPSGYRQYEEDAVWRLRFIRRAKEVGFTLKEVKELLSLRLDAATTCEDVRSRAEAKIAHIDDKIHTLHRMRERLVKLTEACARRSTTGRCPILEALDAGERT